MTIEEGNKIIADSIFSQKALRNVIAKDIMEYGEKNAYSNLRYHESWTWLMNVVINIQKDPAAKILLPRNGIKESIAPFLDAKRPVVKALLDCNLYDLWIAVIEFIQWYQDAVKYLEKQDIIISGTSNGLIDKTNG